MHDKLFVLAMALVAAGLLGACDKKDEPAAKPAASAAPADASGKLYCPMHPEVVQDKAGGSCPKCGMNLEPMPAGNTAPAATGSAGAHPPGHAH